MNRSRFPALGALLLLASTSTGCRDADAADAAGAPDTGCCNAAWQFTVLSSGHLALPADEVVVAVGAYREVLITFAQSQGVGQTENPLTCLNSQTYGPKFRPDAATPFRITGQTFALNRLRVDGADMRFTLFDLQQSCTTNSEINYTVAGIR